MTSADMTLRIIAIFALAISSIVGVTLPFGIDWWHRRQHGDCEQGAGLGRKTRRAVLILTAIGAGVMLATATLHVMPEARDVLNAGLGLDEEDAHAEEEHHEEEEGHVEGEEEHHEEAHEAPPPTLQSYNVVPMSPPQNVDERDRGAAGAYGDEHLEAQDEAAVAEAAAVEAAAESPAPQVWRHEVAASRRPSMKQLLT